MNGASVTLTFYVMHPQGTALKAVVREVTYRVCRVGAKAFQESGMVPWRRKVNVASW